MNVSSSEQPVRCVGDEVWCLPTHTTGTERMYGVNERILNSPNGFHQHCSINLSIFIWLLAAASCCWKSFSLIQNWYLLRKWVTAHSNSPKTLKHTVPLMSEAPGLLFIWTCSSVAGSSKAAPQLMETFSARPLLRVLALNPGINAEDKEILLAETTGPLLADH